MANPSIFAAYAQPVRSFQDYSNEIERGRFLQGQNAIQQAAMAERQQAQAAAQQKQNALAALLSGASSEEDTENRLLNSGNPDFIGMGQGLRDKRMSAKKTGVEIEDKKIDTQNRRVLAWRDAAQQLQNKQDVIGYITAMRQDPLLAGTPVTSEPLEAVIARIPDDPAQLAQYVQKLSLGMTKWTEMNKPQYITRDLGGSVQTMAAPGMGGAPSVVSSSQVTMTPGEKARLAEDQRQFGIREARQAETDSATVGKPFEVTGPDGVPILVRQDKKGNITRVDGFGPKTGASKPLTEGQAKGLLFGSRASEANKVLDELEQAGVTRPGAIKQTAESAANLLPFIGEKVADVAGSMTNFTQSPDQQRVEQAQRDFINAVLRRESGAVISPGEFANAAKQYFPAVGDSPEVKAQKRKNRELAARGLLAEVPEGQRGSLSAPAPAAAPKGPTLDPKALMREADKIIGL